MNEPRFLKFLDTFKGLFKAFKIDYPIMKKILKTKLILDSRRTSTVNMLKKGEGNRKDKNNFLRSLPIYIFMGLILIPFLFLSDDYLMGMSMLFTIFIFLMMTSLISDFSSVLLDIRDNNIILTKPVDSRTLNMAKIIHIFFYVSMITISIIGPSLVVSLFKKGIYFFILYLFSAMFIDLFIIMITALIYLFILKFFNAEKLKDIITYVQIILSAIIAISGQLVGRMFDFNEIFEIRFSPTWWSYLFPPVWFSSFFEFLLNGNRESFIIIYAVLGILMPILSIILYIGFIPSFERNLRKLSEADNQSKDKNKKTRFVSNLVCKTNEEKNFFKFTTNMIKSERNFKLRVYPSLVYGIMFPIIFLFAGGISDVKGTKAYFTIYLISMVVQPIIQVLIYSENHKGAFIYNVFPINYNEVYKGSLKAIFFNLISPLFILMSIIYLYIFKINVLPHLIVVYLNLFLSVYCIFKFKEKELPFSKAYGITNKGNFLEFLKSTFILLGLAGLHFLFTRINYGVYIYLLLVLIANKLLWSKGFNLEG